MGKIILSRENGIPIYCYHIITNSSLNKTSQLLLTASETYKDPSGKSQNPTLALSDTSSEHRRLNTQTMLLRDSLQHTGGRAAKIQKSVYQSLGVTSLPIQIRNQGQQNPFPLSLAPSCAHRSEDRFERLGFHGCEDSGTSSANLTSIFLWLRGGMTAGTNRDHYSSKQRDTTFLAQHPLQRRGDICFHFSPEEMAKLPFSASKRSELTPVIHGVL